MPVLVIEADTPDGNAFNRGHFYQTILKLLGEQTYPQQMHVDIHAEATPPKRRRLSRTATESNDDPELREAAEAAMHRHGVRVIFVDEAHHLLYGKGGTGGSTLQKQLEWLKSLSNKTGVLYILLGTYDLFNFGKLNGQTARRCLPVHFPRYQLEREEDCIEFQGTLLELLRRVPLACEADRWVTEHWLYFYECSVGCIGILKDWLLRAVSTALDDGQTRLSLDCVQDHALPVDIYRQMALDAYEGEQRLNHTASNRELVWRLLQGGELIAPVPPLPPRETPDNGADQTAVPPKSVGTEFTPETQVPNGEPAPPPPIKKTRTRKKTEAALDADPAEPGSVVQSGSGETPPVTPPKRSRKKKTTDKAGVPVETAVKIPSESTDSSPQATTDAQAQQHEQAVAPPAPAIQECERAWRPSMKEGADVSAKEVSAAQFLENHLFPQESFERESLRNRENGGKHGAKLLDACGIFYTEKKDGEHARHVPSLPFPERKRKRLKAL